MGIFESISGAVKGKVDELDKNYNPTRQVADALSNSQPLVPGKTNLQSQYEAKERALNKNNPDYIPGRAKGGPVKKGKKYVVGEKGPEIFVPKASGKIIPNTPKPKPMTMPPKQSSMNMPNMMSTPEQGASIPAHWKKAPVQVNSKIQKIRSRGAKK